jgi:spermidine synthase
MGTTLPILGRAALTGDRRLGREGAWLYALNTAGGVLGLVAVTALSLAGVGTTAALGATLVLNALVAVLALELDRRVAAEPPVGPGLAAGVLPAGPLAVAFVSGLCVLAAETLAVHLFDQVVTLATLGTAAVLLAVVLPLSMAAAGGAWLAARSRHVLRSLGIVLTLACVAALVTPLLFVWQTDGGRYQALELGASVPLFVARAFSVGLVAFGPFVAIAGLVLPLTFRWFEVAGGDPHGRRWGVVLAVNGVGGVLGVELANRVLMPALGMHVGFAAIAVPYGLAAVLLELDADSWSLAVGTASVLGVATIAAVAYLRTLPLVRLDTWPGARGQPVRLVELATGPEGTVAVADLGEDRIILLNNQYALGGSGAFIRQQRMALLPAVLHPAPRRVAFIGLGTGITAGAALVDPAVEEATAYEISPLVAAMSRKHFETLTGGFAADARARVVIEDGRVALAATPGAWDLIVGDLFMPWQVGTGRLYSVEHFRAVREALATGGEFCQWLPGFQLTPEQFRVIVASFREAFPTAYLFRDDRSPETPAFALVGFRDAALDWSVVERRSAVLRESGRTRDGFVAFPQLVRALYVGVADGGAPGVAVRNTLDNGWIERRAGLDQVGRTWRYLDEGTWSSLPEYLRDFSLAAPGPAAR